MRFLDREREMARLNALVQRRASGLAVLWGRRRVGKTRLLVEWCRSHEGLYTVADLSAESIQRRYLAEAVATRFPGLVDGEYRDWRGFFRALTREAQRESWTGPLVLDEFPYLVESSPALSTALQSWIDGEGREAGLLTVIAGSSQHMMQGLALHASSPLYGRAIEAMLLQPLPAGVIGDALGLSDPRDCVRAFAVWGGIPWYWELAAAFSTDLDSAVDHLVLDPLGPLHLEPDRLLAEERPPVVSLRPLLDAIGGGAHRVSEIAGRLNQPATSLGRPLARLAELGLIDRQQPFGEAERGGKRTLYRISDPFFRFWFRVVAPHRAVLTTAASRVRMDLWRRARTTLFSETWESLCRQSVPRLAVEPLAQLGPWGPVARYWQRKGPEWDVVALSMDRRTLLLGEVKWHEAQGAGTAVERAWRDLTAKGRPPLDVGGKVRIVHVVFVPQRPRTRAGKSEPILVDARDVLAALR